MVTSWSKELISIKVCRDEVRDVRASEEEIVKRFATNGVRPEKFLSNCRTLSLSASFYPVRTIFLFTVGVSFGKRGLRGENIKGSSLPTFVEVLKL